MPPYIGKTTYSYGFTPSNRRSFFTDRYGESFDVGKVNHHYTNNPTLTEDQHFSAGLADAAYSLVNTNKSSERSSTRLLKELNNFASNHPIHRETISNLTVIDSSQDHAYVRDNRIYSWDGKEGNKCFFVARGSDFDNHPKYRDTLNDFAIATGSPTYSSFALGQRAQRLMDKHPECIYNIGVGHSKSGHDMSRINWRFDKVYSFEQGQTLWDIKRATNYVRNGSNTTDFRVSCDPISKGVGPPGGTVVHFDNGKKGLYACHSMKNWTDIDNIAPNNNGPILLPTVPKNDNFTKWTFENGNTADFEGFLSSSSRAPKNQTKWSVLNESSTNNSTNNFTYLNKQFNESANIGKNVANDFNQNSPELQKLMDKFTNDFFVMQQEDGQAIILSKMDANEMFKNMPNPGKKINSFDKFVTDFAGKIHEVKSNLENEFSTAASVNNTVAQFDSYLLDFERIYNLKGMKRSHKAKFLGSLALKKISQCNSFLKHCGKNLSFGTRILGDFLENKKLKLRNVVETVLQQKFGIPIREISETIRDLLKGKSIKKDLKNLIKEYAKFLVPQVGAVMGVMELGKHLKGIIRNLTEKTYHKEIGGFDVGVKEKLSFRGLKKPRKKVELYCDILGILITRTSKSYAQSFEDASSEFNRQAFYKAYEVFGIPYEFFDPEREKPETRLDMLRDSRYLRNCETF